NDVKTLLASLPAISRIGSDRTLFAYFSKFNYYGTMKKPRSISYLLDRLKRYYGRYKSTICCFVELLGCQHQLGESSHPSAAIDNSSPISSYSFNFFLTSPLTNSPRNALASIACGSWSISFFKAL